MDSLLSLVAGIEAQVEAIKTEIAEVQTKGSFSYGRSKNIRAAAMEIAKGAKDLRVVTLDTFKAEKTK